MMSRIRGFVLAAVVGATATGALGQYAATYNVWNGWSSSITDLSIFQVSATNPSEFYMSSDFEANGLSTTPLATSGSAIGSFSSFGLGVIHEDGIDHIVMLMNQSVAQQWISTGQSWDALFIGLGSYKTEADMAGLLRNPGANGSALQAFANDLTSFSGGSPWFSGGSNFAVVRFTVATGTPVPEPFTMALVGLAPVVYVRRRKAAAKA